MTAAVETFGLTKTYGTTRAVVELGVRVEQGQVFGFLGPNGGLYECQLARKPVSMPGDGQTTAVHRAGRPAALLPARVEGSRGGIALDGEFRRRVLTRLLQGRRRPPHRRI